MRHPWVPSWKWGSCTQGQRCHLALQLPRWVAVARGQDLSPLREEGTVTPQPHRCPRCQHCVTLSCLSPLALGEVWGSPLLSHRDKGGAGCYDKYPTLPSPGSSCLFGKGVTWAELVKSNHFSQKF